MQPPAAHTRPFQIFEALFAPALLLGWALGFFFPLPLSRWVPRPLTAPAGAVVLLAGLVLVTVTRRQFRLERQPTDPGRPTTRLVTTGIFSWSRNPLYLAGMLFYLGLALLFDSLWLMMFFLPLAAAVHFVLIRPEERYLAAVFGEPYRQYRRSVRRWFGRSR